MNQSIKLEMLYYFVVLAEIGHFGLAADKLFITQQALSKSIRQLEEKLGTSLFERNGRSQYLTPAGRKLQQNAYRILAKTRLVEMQYSSQTALAAQPQLKIGFHQVFDDRIYVLVKQYIRNYQDIFVQLSHINSLARCEEMLLAHEIDLGISLQPSLCERLNCKILQKLEFVIVGHPDTPFQEWHELAYIQNISATRRDGFNQMVAWPEDLFPRRIIAEADFTTGIALCELGLGALYLFKEGIAYELANETLKIVAHPPFSHELNVYLLWRMDDPETSLICELIRSLILQPASVFQDNIQAT